jgi:hypothetical protein
MRRRHLQVAVVVVEHGQGLVVRGAVLKQERRNQVRLVITGVAQEESVQPQVLLLADMAGVQDNMDKQHLHNRVMDDTEEISIPIQLGLVGRMDQYGKAIGTVGTYIKDYSLDLI